MPESWTKEKEIKKETGSERGRGIRRQRTEEWCADFQEAAPMGF